jgi:DNA-binding protein HU-beta
MKSSRKDLIKRVATKTGATQVQTKATIDACFTEIVSQAVKGNTVQIDGFGIFKPATSPARIARNPATGGTVQVAAKNTLKFKISKTLKDQLNK